MPVKYNRNKQKYVKIADTYNSMNWWKPYLGEVWEVVAYVAHSDFYRVKRPSEYGDVLTGGIPADYCKPALEKVI